MGWFGFKKKIIKEIYGGAWGHLVNDHGLTVDVLSKSIRCVEKPEVRDGGKVNLLRVFSLHDVAKKGVVVEGWETFDRHPDLVLFEGSLDDNNVASLVRRNGAAEPA